MEKQLESNGKTNGKLKANDRQVESLHPHGFLRNVIVSPVQGPS